MAVEILDQSESLNKEDPTAQILFRVPWLERVSISRQLLGGALLVSGFPVFIPGALHPEINGLFASQVNIRPHGKTRTIDDIDSWEFALLDVTYKKPEGPTDEEGNPTDLGEERLTLGATTIQLPKENFKWHEGYKTEKKLNGQDIDPFKVVVEGTYSITFHYVFNWNLASWEEKIGKVNSAPFGNANLPIGTVLYLGVETNRKFSTDGFEFWKVTQNFAYQPHGWNKFWDGAAWSELVNINGGANPYEEADLNNII